MLRSLVLVLLLVNAGFYAWCHGWLNGVVGAQPDDQREPQRLNLQVHADQLIVTPAKAADPVPSGAAEQPSAPASSPAAAPSDAAVAALASASAAAVSIDTGRPNRAICVEAGPFSAAEQPQVEALLKPLLAPNAWTSENVTVQGLWLAYMGPYADAEVLARKLAELHRIKGLNFEEIHTPANLAHGLSLGRYSRLEDANAALATLKLRGIRTARVVALRQPMDVQVVRVPSADINTQVALSGLKLPQGKGFTACRN